MSSEDEGPRIHGGADWDLIPAHMHEGITAYVETGRPMGHFLTAVLSNDLREAAARADDENTLALAGWVKFLYNYVPSECWGSLEAMARWREYHAERREATPDAS
ncbi:hypothetical protein LCGC14_0391690 [marine sediment metagenome]|uniref:Uncharacterized protein n=1 Tax=marine sediment metagenome TaxID=412755 RepID=A0A0F9W8J5_9ZZZZ